MKIFRKLVFLLVLAPSLASAAWDRVATSETPAAKGPATLETRDRALAATLYEELS